MSTPPTHPKIYHITHVDNLAAMIADGCILSDAQMISRGGPSTPIGMSDIKRRRLSLRIACNPPDCVGDYVPFYFCPRSVMLYVIHCANHESLTYRGGQGPIVHLEADLEAVVDWSDRQRRRWVFSLSNAGAKYTEFRASLDELDQINWLAVSANQWSAPDIREGKQAEFLIRDSFPWDLVSRIGVKSEGMRMKVTDILALSQHEPHVDVMPDWYY